jgi:prophage maintenance system killer protein
LPIPFFGFRLIYEQLVRAEWDDPIGVLPPFEFANQDLILSALGQPFTSVGGQDAYPTVPEKAATLFRGLVKNHGLRDGNKRVAVTVMSTFLLANGWIPRYSNHQLYRYALRVAMQPGNYPLAPIVRWVRRNIELMSDRDLAVVRRQNRRMLEAREDIMADALAPVLLQLEADEGPVTA